jgi:hypothetical protein
MDGRDWKADSISRVSWALDMNDATKANWVGFFPPFWLPLRPWIRDYWFFFFFTSLRIGHRFQAFFRGTGVE